VPEAKRLLAHEAVSEWVAPFDAASLVQQHCVWSSDPYSGVWSISGIMDHKWSCILRRNHVRLAVWCRVFGVVYLIIGLVVAFTHGYVLTSVGEFLSFILAVLLWPLVLFGFNLHIAI
jgi:Mn2+/Fe2+ NRAMP family transporter